MDTVQFKYRWLVLLIFCDKKNNSLNDWKCFKCVSQDLLMISLHLINLSYSNKSNNHEKSVHYTGLHNLSTMYHQQWYILHNIHIANNCLSCKKKYIQCSVSWLFAWEFVWEIRWSLSALDGRHPGRWRRDGGFSQKNMLLMEITISLFLMLVYINNKTKDF